MSWGRKSRISQIDAAMEFIRTGSLAYNLLPVAGAARVGCIDSSHCGSGWKCEKGYCVPDDGPGGGGCGGGGKEDPCPPGGSGGASSGGGVDGCNKAGCGGSGGGGGGGNADDCCGLGRCCRIGNGFVQCFCGDCPDPPSCDEFCSAYKAANGEDAPGCGGEDGCDECSRCVDQGNFQGGKCEPISNGPCWCEKSACRGCETCTEDGTCVEDCRTCETCVTMYNHPCPCGYATLKCCWSACNGTPDYTQCALEGCAKAGLSEDDCAPKCEDCTSVSRCYGLPCPEGYTQKGQVCVGDDCCLICEKCEPTNDPRCGCNSHAECPDCYLCGSDGECYPDPRCTNGVGVWYVESTAIDRVSTYNEYRVVEIGEPYVIQGGIYDGQLYENRIVSFAQLANPSDVSDYTPNDGSTVFFQARDRTLTAKNNSYWNDCDEGYSRVNSITSGALQLAIYRDGAYQSSLLTIGALLALRINCEFRSASETTTLTYIGPGTISDWYSGSVGFTCNNYGSSRVCTSGTPFSPDLPGPS